AIIAACTDAVKDWWLELSTEYGDNPTNNFTHTVFSQNFLHFTQMAWGKTHKIGCGSALHYNYGHKINVVCHYLPRGNVENELIYELGEPCKDHSDCDIGKCLKESGLCRKTEKSIFGRLFRYPV
ncbi:unnamed protein product, partial [Acanthocheilonema viteae]